ncbi:Copper amine oxidase N-terminal domain-containing protein [Gracilibacillus ureilyticus]|uniref:Copper amine oxidase N-terminal domain-containing protein n=1 Tax=Gracilibacillus ureilyticus TaxID=531814 RepID=A0A1H9MN43_9BACI|nr:copper amine oxidase N-terminal domain-containing protein [Gracilibacillus ureilyticus]SER24865.1 Copper amine oxidase N-terminal domain-containing protein [Gracilibacillus ureilyticus]
MKRTFLTAIMLISCLFILFPGSSFAVDQTDDTYIRDGLLFKSTAFLPMRSIFEAFDSTVKWDGETRTVTAINENHTIVLKIDSDIALIDGVKKKLPEKVMIFQGSTMVPVRFISETLGAEVEWRSEFKEVIITKEDMQFTIRTFPTKGYEEDEYGVAYKEHQIQAVEFYREYEAMFERITAFGKNPAKSEWDSFQAEFEELYNNKWAFYYIDAYEDYEYIISASEVQYNILEFVHLIDRHVSGDTSLTSYYGQEYNSLKNNIIQGLNGLKHDIHYNIIPK